MTRTSTPNALQFNISPGQPLPLGATVTAVGVNFSIFSFFAQDCSLLLFKSGESTPYAELPFPAEYRFGAVFAMLVLDLNPDEFEYGYRINGPNQPEAGHRFDSTKILLDPYAKSITGRGLWKQPADSAADFPNRGRISVPYFDWKGDRPLGTPMEDLIIYEMHVRGFTAHPSSAVKSPGTYAGLIEKIPYLRQLGVNCVELMPVFDFDEFDNSRKNGETGELLVNQWGYSTVSFFAPKAGFAASGAEGGEINELKWLIKSLHENGIEVILDVVFNHTAEGNENGPTISFRGIDNKTFYILTPEGYYYNFTGTGNTFNSNHPAVIEFIVDCLRYWATEYHIDGFRFDLASALTRAENGMPLADTPLMKMLAHDPVLANVKLIAEPWDADGLYHVGSFPAYGRWAEWNGKYRDALRKYLKGEAGLVEEVIQRMQGSPDLYPGRGPIASINFVTAHDGFTLNDLVSYNEKHNEANLEDNRDGHNDNQSWNSGAEGTTDDPAINALRRRQIKNAVTLLLVSQGVPMLLMGDEIARTQQGNNNVYRQDNELSWFDWSSIEPNSDLLRYFQRMIAFRHAHPVLRSGYYFRYEDYNEVGCVDLSWFSTEALAGDEEDERLTLAFMLCGAYAKGGLAQDDDVFVTMNMHWEDQIFELPALAKGKAWHSFANTGADAPDDIHDLGSEPPLEDQKSLTLKSRSVAVLVGR
ncbi:MAG: glycogen debranching protein GlgX [Chloroflexota bacterium]